MATRILVAILVVVALLGALGVGGFLLWKRLTVRRQDDTAVSSSGTSGSTEPSEKKKMPQPQLSCPPGRIDYPICHVDMCHNVTCSGHGTCSLGSCTCDEGYAGPWCSRCASNFIGYPNCTREPTCESGQWLDNSKRPVPVCTPLTACAPDEYETVSPTKYSDRTCGPLTVCTAQQYESVAPTATTDRQCADLTVCGRFEHQTVAPTDKRDRQCAKNVCACEGGVPVADCPAHGQTKCARCDPQHYAAGDACRPWTDCGHDDGKYVTQQPSSTRDRRCADITVCRGETYESRAPVVAGDGRATSDRVCTALTTCDGHFQRVKRDAVRSGDHYVSDRECADYIPSGTYAIKGHWINQWCSDEGDNAIRCTRGNIQSHEKFYVQNIGQKFRDMGDGYLRMSEDVIPKTNALTGQMIKREWGVPTYDAARDKCESLPGCTAFSHNPDDWTFFFSAYNRDMCQKGMWVDQKYRGNYGAGWHTYERKHLTPFYDQVAIKGSNQHKWCATDDDKSWIKCNRGSIGSYERFIVHPWGGNQFALAGRRCGNRWCGDGGHEGIKCNSTRNFDRWNKFTFLKQ